MSVSWDVPKTVSLRHKGRGKVCVYPTSLDPNLWDHSVYVVVVELNGKLENSDYDLKTLIMLCYRGICSTFFKCELLKDWEKVIQGSCNWRRRS